ncbi:glutamine amidotransferase-related protein [Candidatus Vampirococcus lugosii]|uniref:Glutamine amidotransferase domain-containing protein n=1 Tax=Candidatus Vampirococcus lugosii TaxID=2789015 RepID=A0ABS5QL62_9BACT|nr:hypothetical protein [Candidatus Vampirococcus lugosii]MBS8121940.1 hypothetical protein [Candidatus Vampirococcus lugosii]
MNNIREYDEFEGKNNDDEEVFNSNLADALSDTFLINEKNSNLLSKEKLENIRQNLLQTTEKLYEQNNSNKPILIVSDGTYLSIKEKVLKEIYGEKLYQKYTQVVNIKYNDGGLDIEDLDNYLKSNIHSNSLILLGGSISDIVDINPFISNSFFFSFLKDIIENTGDISKNNFLLGICYGHQLISHISGNEMEKCGSDFSIKTCQFEKEIPEFYKKCFVGLNNENQNNGFNSVFTRSWKVGKNYNDDFVPLIADQNGFGNKSETFLSIQFHPEVPIKDIDNINKLKNELSKLGVDIDSLSFDEQKLSESIDKHFFIPVFDNIISKILTRFNKEKSEYSEMNLNLINVNKLRSTRLVGDFLSESYLDFNFPKREDYFNYLYNNGLLYLNSNFDRKVDRGVKEVSNTLGLKSTSKIISELQKYKKEIDKNAVFTVRDMGAGDGTFLEESYKDLSGKDILFSGVGDKIYIDLYKGIKNSKYSWQIPDDILKIFVKKFIQIKNDIEKQSGKKEIKEILPKILSSINISKGDVVLDDSMFAESTSMFDYVGGNSLSEESLKFLESSDGKNKINNLKNDIQLNFLGFVKGYFERIFVSDFNSYFDNLEEIRFKYSSDLKKCDLNLSVRGTSHLNNKDYYNLMYDLIDKGLNDGGIIIDDGIIRSYTYENRFLEFLKLQDIFSDTIKIFIISDLKDDIKSVIIQKKPFNDELDLSNHVMEGFFVESIETFDNNDIIVNSYVRNLVHNYIYSLSFGKDIYKKIDNKLSLNINHIINLINNDNYEEIYFKIDEIIDDLGKEYLENICRNSSIKNFKSLKLRLENTIRFKKEISSIVSKILKQDNNDYDYLILYESEKHKNNIELHLNIFDELIKEQEEKSNVNKINIKPFQTLLNFFDSMNEVSDPKVLEELSSLSPYILPLLESKDLLLETLGLDKFLDKKFESEKDDLDKSLENIFWKNVKILVIDNIPSMKKLLDVVFVSDLGVNRDNITMLSSCEDGLLSLSKCDFDVVIVQKDLDINSNFSILNYINSIGTNLLYIGGDDKNIDVGNNLSYKELVHPFTKKELQESIASFDGLVDKTILDI